MEDIMNDLVKGCVEGRKNALFASYNIKDPGTLSQIDDYFKRVEEFAKDCTDVMDFETKFASSPLSQEYTDLFTMVMSTEVDSDGNAPVTTVEEEYTIQDEMIDDATRLARRKARQKVYDVARDVPGLGQAITAKQHVDFFGRFFKKKGDE
jgi:hypothetical protein